MLALFCQISNEFLSDALRQFQLTSMITMETLLYQGFHPIIPGEMLALNKTPYFLVPGMKVGCTAKDSLSQSTLQCFFDETCLNTIANLSSTTQRPSSLKAVSRFRPNTTIDEIFQKLMLEALNARISFRDYYRSCSPRICTYSYSKRFSLIYILTTITSLVGGLTAIFRILSPLIVQFLLRQIRQYFMRHNRERISTINPLENITIQTRLKNLLVLLRHKILTLNLIKNRLLDVKHGIYSTRVYILLLLIGLTILTVYFSMTSHVFTHSITKPTLKQYEELHRTYPTTLKCPCERISMNYSSIMTLIPRYHQICTSGFVRNEQWLNFWSVNQTDYYLSNQPFFLTLKFICDLSSTIVPNLLVIFNSTQFMYTIDAQVNRKANEFDFLLNLF